MEKNSSLISFSNSGIKKKITCQQFFRFSLQLVYLTATCDRSNEILINLHSRQLTVLGHLPVQNRYKTLRCKCKFNRIHYFILARLCSNVTYLSRCEPKFFQVFISCCPKWVRYFHTQIQYVQWKHEQNKGYYFSKVVSYQSFVSKWWHVKVSMLLSCLTKQT